MTYTLELTIDADDDLFRILLYTELRFGERYTDKYQNELEATFDRLTQFPEIGRFDERINRRILKVGKHLIIYGVNDTEFRVEIIRILHEKEDFRSNF